MDNKLDAEFDITEVDVNEYRLIKYPSAGRPSVDDDPALQKEYNNIYLDRIIRGMTEQQIADTRQISRAKVKKALEWCRDSNTAYTTADDLTDAINTLDYRLSKLVEEQDNSLRQKLAIEQKKFDAWNNATEEERQSLPKPDIRTMETLHRLTLLYEDRILNILESRFNLQNLLQKQIQIITTPYLRRTRMIEEADIMGFFLRMVSPEDRAQILGIIDKYAKPPM